MSALKPLIGVICNFRDEDGHRMHLVGERYLTNIMELCGGAAVAIPVFEDAAAAVHTLAHLDGVILTGGRANIEPKHYDGPACPPDEIIDPRRDATAFQLVRGAVEQGVPLFGICRGLQEMNVALGGSLFHRLHEVEGRFDHRMERHVPLEYRLRPRQRITIQPGGVLQSLTGDDTVIVNTLHGQGIDRLADGLRLEAVADDGTVEAVSVADAKTFAVGVQWHAEYEPQQHYFYKALFEAFAAAAVERMRDRLGAHATTTTTIAAE